MACVRYDLGMCPLYGASVLCVRYDLGMCPLYGASVLTVQLANPKSVMPHTSDDNLVARLKAGDQAAYAQLVEENASKIYQLALRMMGNEADAEDVLQETFLSAFKSIDKFEERSSLSTWLYRIASNAALMRLRRKEPDQISVDEPLERDDGELIPRQFFDFCCLPEEDLLRDEARAEMKRAVEELPPTLRSVFVLRDIEGLSTEERLIDFSREKPLDARTT